MVWAEETRIDNSRRRPRMTRENIALLVNQLLRLVLGSMARAHRSHREAMHHGWLMRGPVVELRGGRRGLGGGE